ncbi:uncharacterized protein PHALS_03923 [Plasmopara halstedii]|uniref:Uncharacterized protein n=1 Tax=Plasmopara halstedii TaxID=4781 RepID=A0A0P1B0S6_PLAHL|nr:uncharacterized protein PHALS_03923 [Plasmopara halstedii]CEG47277.1 hypothetical protein PHALS_03923 [Plasmopara halstedii]|eukprot:XP_024583646.1 hypothetical protein PHALS_03923 [Plasmopara halstedii]
MVAISTSPRSTDMGFGNMPAPGINKCRYKTGKCVNTRSKKRNGQLHQLCKYHRDKANGIQRRFDRQKRELERALKLTGLHTFDSPISTSTMDCTNVAELTSIMTTLDASPTGSTNSTTSMTSESYSSLLLSNVDAFSPDSPDCELNESVWADLPVNESSFYGEDSDMPLPITCNQSYLSVDEIDFLCSAILE